MRDTLRRLAIIGVLAATLGASSARVARAVDIGDIVQVFGIAYAVRVFGDEINSFLNSVFAQRGVRWEGRTKVVPMLSLGSGAFIGAAQVAGPPDRVRETRAVAAGEVRVISNVRVTGIIPINTTNPLRRSFRRIEGVGLSALIDFRI
ncbi:MAG: hypothetical protein HY320_02905 [Armatimonadetes bacterium]|nr:hypothetical protein [Armatimonadota bacterium]